jgi:GNAT superfamily N-acetyltransferase
MITPFPIHEAVELSTEAGWNQTPGDWQRIVDLCGEGCFGVQVDGRLVSSATALVYDESLAWIGMVLTAQAHRGKGYAGGLMRQSLDYLDQRGVRCVKLDATDLGRPVYAKLGFVDERPVSRWLRVGGERPALPDLVAGDVDLATLDREAFGADRSALLRALRDQEEVYTASGGFAFARPGRKARQFGPCVARDVSTARVLLAAFLAKHGDEPSILDLCDDHQDAVEIASAAGFTPVRRLVRMYRGDPGGAGLASGPMVYALAGFEFG